MKSLLSDSKQKVSLAIDIWTSITTASYMVTTAHFIDDNWRLHRKIISFNTVPDHKGETISKKIKKNVCLNGVSRGCSQSPWIMQVVMMVSFNIGQIN